MKDTLKDQSGWVEQFAKDSFQDWCEQKGIERGLSKAGRHNGPLDGFRHTFMNAVMTYWLNTDEARRISSAHENANKNPSREHYMDEYNNALGRIIGERFKSTIAFNIHDRMADYVMQEIRDGGVIISINDPRIPEDLDTFPVPLKSKPKSNKPKATPKTGRYIWRTQGDGDVRSSHAMREGQVYSWDNPPEGGHPGEEYGCRYWAEPYDEPELTALAQLFKR